MTRTGSMLAMAVTIVGMAAVLASGSGDGGLAGTALASGDVPLSPETYAPIDATYTAFVAIEKHSATAEPRFYPAARAACAALDSGDHLLRALRHRCTLTLHVRQDADRLLMCRGRLQCQGRALRARLATSGLTIRSRDFNDQLKRSNLPARCAAALRTTRAQLAFVRHEQDYFHLIELLTDRTSPPLPRRVRQLGRFVVTHPGEGSLAAVRERRTFRAACAPPAPA